MTSVTSALASALGVGIVSPTFWAVLGAILSLLGWFIVESVRSRTTPPSWRDAVDMLVGVSIATLALACVIIAIAQVIAAQG